MITLAQYFAGKSHSPSQEATASDLLSRREALRAEYRLATGRCMLDIDPDTGTEISGSRGGKGDGGFRLQSATTGATNSSHKTAQAVDDYDPGNHFDTWLDLFDYDKRQGNAMLEKYRLYREHPAATPGWVHLTTRAPGSGKRTFMP